MAGGALRTSSAIGTFCGNSPAAIPASTVPSETAPHFVYTAPPSTGQSLCAVVVVTDARGSTGGSGSRSGSCSGSISGFGSSTFLAFCCGGM